MKHKLMRGAFFITLAQFATVFSNYLIHVGLARFFGPAVYGNFGVILSLMFITKTIFMTGLHRAIAKYVSEFKDKVNVVFREGIKLQILFVIIITFLYFMFSKNIAMLFNDLSLEKLIFFSAITFLPVGIYNVTAKGFLNGMRLFKHQAIAESVHSVLKAIFAFILVYLGYGLFGAVAAYAIAPFFAFLLAIFFIKKKVPKESGGAVESSESSLKSQLEKANKNYFDKGKLIRFALPLSIFYVVITLSMELGLLSVKSMLTNDVLTGFYTSASTLSKIILSLFTALPLTLLPSISAAISDNNHYLVKKYINKSLRYSMMILFPVAVLMSSHAKQIISFLYSSSYIAAAPSLTILVFGFTFIAFFMLQCSFLTGAGKPIIPTIISGIILITMYVMNLFLIPKQGLEGAAISTTIAAFIGLVISSSYIKIHFKTLVNIGSFFRIIFASSIIYVIGYYWSLPGINFIVSFCLLFALYIFILILFREITKEDQQLLISSLNLHKLRGLLGKR